MKAGAGAPKGGAFEREINKRLSLWLSNGERDDLLWRTPNSGGRATVMFRRGQINRALAGDAMAVDRLAYEFMERTFVEYKFYQALQIDRSFLCGTGSLITFWKKAALEARNYDKRPLLVARQNRFPIIAITSAADPVFTERPLITLNHWSAFVYLFEEVTRVRRKLVRMA